MICDDSVELDQDFFPVRKKSYRAVSCVEEHLFKRWNKSSNTAKDKIEKSEHD